MSPVTTDGVDRRAALKAMAAATLALSTAACSAPRGEIVPYVRMPERLVPGSPLFFATASLLDGYAQPVVVETHEGRPTKVEGNPDHPWSRGAADAYAQAAILALYDPDRSRTIKRGGQIDTEGAFLQAIEARRPAWIAARGRGLRLLSGRVTSPSLAAAIGHVLQTYPEARWHRWAPINADNARAGAAQAFGRRLDAMPALDKAHVIIAVDADPLGPGPCQIRYGRDFAAGRRARHDSTRLTRLHVVEPTLTLTGAAADARLALTRADCGRFAAALAAGFGGPAADAPAGSADLLARIKTEIAAANGAAVILVGEGQPAEVHALAHWINGRIGALGSIVSFVEPPEADPVAHGDSLRDLARDALGDQVDTLLILGGNPGFDAPVDIRFAAALRHVPLTIRHGLYEDETSALCAWHVPSLHAFEAWGDARAPDGRVSLIQPMIAPLYGGRDAYDLLAILTGGRAASDHDAVRAYWQTVHAAADFDDWWRTALHDGAVSDSAAKTVAVSAPADPPRLPTVATQRDFELVFAPDPSVWDGAFASNAWLQETPQPFSKQVWGNAVAIGQPDAQRLSIEAGDILRITVAEVTLDAPAWIAPGQAPGTLGLTIGQGRHAGMLARDVGYDAYGLRRSDALWRAAPATVIRTGDRRTLPVTQAEHKMDGRDIVRALPLAALSTLHKPERDPPTLYPETPARGPVENAYAMVIDQSVCIGCNACVVACRSENNVPIVGPEEVLAGRDMAWLRVDSYESDTGVAFQPVPCMHCEKAPCEPVCPVGASVHDSDGLNVQVYNRCVGTRFCQANCPYGVRRFNFFGYADGQEYADMGEPILQALHNPDVSVRARGVMEKCTYCVQRISRARRTAEKEDRRIRDGEIVTACQQTCPVEAIAFGDLLDADSKVVSLRREPHEYGLLADLGTRPRTTYLARVRDEGRV